MATILPTVAIVVSVISVGASIWFALRKDRMDVRAAREAELAKARQEGYDEAVKDARLASVEARLKELDHGGQQ